jgi:hypothetical protein
VEPAKRGKRFPRVAVVGLALVILLAANPARAVPTRRVWRAVGNQARALFGREVSDAGDVNGDGFDDVVVSADSYHNGQEDEGKVFVFLGSPSGPDANPIWTAEGNQGGARFGLSVSGAGDVNGDGFDDLIVGTPDYHAGRPYEGRAFLYLGSPSGPSPTPTWVTEGHKAGAYYGESVSGAGDVNGDGFDDVIVGGNGYDRGRGRVFVFLGSRIGLSPSPDWTVGDFEDEWYFGLSVSGAGDVNGDGFADVIVGARDSGGAVVYQGSPHGLSETPAWSARGGGYFGAWVSGAGDVNGDGFDDVIVGAPIFADGQTDEGAAYVYLGSAGGVSPSPVWSTEGDQEGAFFGCSVAGAGDVNGDGYDDIVVGAYGYAAEFTNEGRAFVYLGSPTGPGQQPRTVDAHQEGAYLGFEVSAAGDVNDDGLGDVIVGAMGYAHAGIDGGAAFVSY